VLGVVIHECREFLMYALQQCYLARYGSKGHDTVCIGLHHLKDTFHAP
jgi:hypothetical protein